MGYHVYDLAEFDLAVVGRHRTYLYLFSQDPAARLRFAEEIGSTAVSITNGVKDIDWLLLGGLPYWLNYHAFFYSTVVVLCPTKADATKFLSYLKKVFAWQKAARTQREPEGLDLVALSELEGVGVISIPRGGQELHDRGLLGLAQLVRDGVARSFVQKGELKQLGERLGAITGLRCHIHKSLLVVDTGRVLTPPDELLKVEFEELFSALRELKDELASLPQDKRINSMLRELGEIRKELGTSRETGSGVSVQASVGFEAFGNGLKVLFDSGQISESPWQRARALFKRIGSGENEPPSD